VRFRRDARLGTGFFLAAFFRDVFFFALRAFCASATRRRYAACLQAFEQNLAPHRGPPAQEAGIGSPHCWHSRV
jgi:hypothetical protein